jgi:hypothetical protein
LDWDAAANLISQHLVANWTATPVVWENQNYDPVSDPAAASGFVYASMELLDGRQIAFGGQGGSLYRDFAGISLDVMVPKGSQIGLARQRATQLRALFHDWSLLGTESIRLHERIIHGETITSKDSRYWGLQVYLVVSYDRIE